MKPTSFVAITSEGGLLPADFLAELLAPKSSIVGLEPKDYNLAEGERISEAVNRSWQRLKGRWADFKKVLATKSPGDPTTTETRDRWLHPLFQELGFGQRLPIAQPIEVDGHSYPVSHGWSHVPIHLVGTHADLDHRTPGAIGAAKASPYSLVQQALNASDKHLWGIVSNGLVFRLLRDNIALTRLSYVEWDLAAIFDGDLYSEFFVLWLVCHQSRFEGGAEGGSPQTCILEQWKKSAEDKGLRALDELRPGVAHAIEALGAGLVANPDNRALLTKLRSGELTTQEFYRQVLRVIYRMLFLFVAEDRDLLHPPFSSSSSSRREEAQTSQSAIGNQQSEISLAPGEIRQPGSSVTGGPSGTDRSAYDLARQRYREYYGITRLRGLTLHRAGTPHPDLWDIFQLLTQKLGSNTGCPELALPALGSFLWDATRSTPDLVGTVVSNRQFLTAVHALAFVQDGSVRRPIDYKNLGSEELGSVYEGLLELHPLINADSGVFTLDTAAGNERKTSGSYYTPDSLVQCLLDSALEPVIKERLAEARAKASKSPKTAKDSPLNPNAEPRQDAANVSPSPRLAGAEGPNGERAGVRCSSHHLDSQGRGDYFHLAEQAILSLKVCDPAVGSGHFLIAAAHRIAKHLAALRSGEDEPSPAVYRTALRDVIGHCLYGVDINPMSAELCRVNLWLEALEPGKPLSFLDHHIRVGNSLLGATPELIRGGIPDAAYDPIEGDDKAACTALKKQNKRENPKLGEWFANDEAAIRDKLFQAATAIDAIADNRPEDIQKKETAFRAEQTNYDFQKAWDLANLWCAAFVIKKHFLNPSPTGVGEDGRRPGEGRGAEPATSNAQPSTVQSSLFGGMEEASKTKGRKPSAQSPSPTATPFGVTTQHLRDFVAGGALPDGLLAEAKRLAEQYQFFHWHLIFPEGFAQGGFDVSLGNPPWERVKLQEKEWFAERRPDIANAPNAAARKRLIEALSTEAPAGFDQFNSALRQANGETHLMRASGLYPLCGRGDINLYSIFAERIRGTLRSTGRSGLILPSGLATDDTTKHFFCDLLTKQALISFFEFENEGFFKGAGQGHMVRFALTTVSGTALTSEANFVFQAKDIAELRDEQRHFSLTSTDIDLLSPNTRTCPIFRSRQDAEITKLIHRRMPVLWRESDQQHGEWKVEFKAMFHMANASYLFRTRPQLEQEGWLLNGNIFERAGLRYLPLYEAKMVQQYNHRHGDFSKTHGGERAHILPAMPVQQLEKSDSITMPFYWIPESEVAARLDGIVDRRWLLGWRDVTDARASARTVIACVIPRAGVNDKFLLMFSPEQDLPLLYCTLLSFAFDYAARQKVAGLALKYFTMRQLPTLSPSAFSHVCIWSGAKIKYRDWLLPRVLEMTYTAWDLEPFAQDCGWSGPPFRWDEARRFLLRCELDAAFFHLYLGTPEEWQKQPEALTKAFPTPRAAVAYIMDTFPIVRRKDEANFNGDYRTKRVILEIYDALAESIRTGVPYQTRLNPPPASIAVAHLPRFDRERFNFKEPGDYILQFVASLLRHQGGECDVMILIRAYAMLLGDRKTLSALAETLFGAEAGAWVKRFYQPVDADWFMPIIVGLDNRDVIKLEERGEKDVFVRLLDTSVPSNSTVETDVYLFLHVLDLNAVTPAAVAEQIKRISPKTIRTSIREAKLAIA